jgi:hypothetical protein
MTTEHAPIAPSSLYLTVACNGWIKQSSKVPAEYLKAHEDAAKEGEAAHWVALAGALMGAEEVNALLGLKAPNGVEITSEMIDGAHLYIDALEGLPGAMEERVEIPRIHPTACWGTPDRWLYTPNTRTLRVTDYKFGFEYVEVWECWQLIAYAVGILDKLGLHDDLDRIILELVIVQPRLSHPDGPVRMWTVAANVLRAMVNEANQSAHNALGPNPTTKSGPHCLHCPARGGHCQTFSKATANVIEFSGHADPIVMDPKDVGNELRLVMRARAMLKARQTGLEAQAEALLRQGKTVPHFAMQPGQSRWKWFEDVKPEEVEALAKALDATKTVLKPPELRTPTQVFKGKVLDEAVINQYADRPPGAMKLAPVSDTKAAKVFSK